jgi:hypothetical protein
MGFQGTVQMDGSQRASDQRAENEGQVGDGLQRPSRPTGVPGLLGKVLGGVSYVSQFLRPRRPGYAVGPIAHARLF